MQLQLTDREAHTLFDLLHDYLPVLQREVARTDSKEFRRLLLDRLTLVERLLEELPSEATESVMR